MERRAIAGVRAVVAIALLATAIAFGLWDAPAARAGSLAERVERFPDWQSKPSVPTARGDLDYPDWMGGTWEVTSTLLDLSAPLAPDIVTPGFEGYRRYLNRPVKFVVRFVPEVRAVNSWLGGRSARRVVVADREFNGEQIAKAYMGGDRPVRVEVDDENPNYQVTRMGNDRQLFSVVTRRGSETEGDRFIATEVYIQVFRSSQRVYLNEVETTTDYHKRAGDRLEGQQLTAVYLSPKDPDYFVANGRPVALYRYALELKEIPEVSGKG